MLTGFLGGGNIYMRHRRSTFDLSLPLDERTRICLRSCRFERYPRWSVNVYEIRDRVFLLTGK